MSRDWQAHRPIFIIIPLFNKASLISILLDAIERQTLRPHAVVFVDSGSQDNYEEAIQKESQDKSYKIHLLSSVEKGKISMPGRSRNIGVEFVPAEAIIAFLDMGTFPRPDWLELQINSDGFKRNGGVMGSCLFRANGLWALIVCAISYGVETVRPTLPGSVLTKELQLQIGTLREDLRAAEDLLWKKKFISITEQYQSGPGLVVYGQFANSLWSNIKKWFIYAQHISKAKVNRGHLLFALLAFFSMILMSYTRLGIEGSGLFILGVHLILRGIIGPWWRSQKCPWFGQNLWALLLAPLMVFFLDASRMCGYVVGIYHHKKNGMTTS